jgi:histone-lysine N-methyltransferase SETMAR
LKDILKEKRHEKFTKWVLFLHDHAPAHRVLATQKKLAYLGFQYIDHPPYSPDLAPLDHPLFPGLKKQLKGRHFSSDATNTHVISNSTVYYTSKQAYIYRHTTRYSSP